MLKRPSFIRKESLRPLVHAEWPEVFFLIEQEQRPLEVSLLTVRDRPPTQQHGLVFKALFRLLGTGETNKEWVIHL